MNEHDDSGRFTIRDEAPEPDAIEIPDVQIEAENLRLKKLNTRITLVAVLVPCLCIVILVAAYLDIKKRLETTQFSGTMGVQNLASDLESRFSSLSLKQAKIDEQLVEQAKALETANATLQTSLKKSVAEVQRSLENRPDRAALEAITQKTSADMTALHKELTALNAAFEKFDTELAGQIQQMTDGVKKAQERMADLEKKTQSLAAGQINKEALDLALRLERLSLQDMVKEKIAGLDRRIAAVQKEQAALKQRLDVLSRSASTTTPKSPAKAAVPQTYMPPKPATPAPGGSSGAITEQPIN